MKIIFLTMSNLKKLDNSGIYGDLMRKFRDKGHEVYVVSPRERRVGENTHFYDADGVHFLGVKTLNLQKTNAIEKGIGQVLVETQFKRAIKKHLGAIKADLILYSTPPITFPKVIAYLKSVNPSAMSYLLLKDIFPQNAVDLGMMSKSGAKGLLYKYFRKKEKDLYALSNYIGCMSPANVRYLLDHNPEIASERVEVAPNSVEIPCGENSATAGKPILNDNPAVTIKTNNSCDSCSDIRKRYGLPMDKPVFIYGGNLGKPQGVPFLIQCLEANAERKDCHFVVVGDGTEYGAIEAWYKMKQPPSVSIFRRLPKVDYDQLVQNCDVGLIFLDYRFTIPNYPSRLLSYLMVRKPIIAATDLSCDTGSIAEENGYGYWCPSNDVNAFTKCVNKMLSSNIAEMGSSGYRYFLDHYTVDETYRVIMSHFSNLQ